MKYKEMRQTQEKKLPEIVGMLCDILHLKLFLNELTYVNICCVNLMQKISQLPLHHRSVKKLIKFRISKMLTRELQRKRRKNTRFKKNI